MIKIHFFDWNADSLDVEKEMGIDGDIIDFLSERIAGIEFEATDNVSDMENNWIFWFRAKRESEAITDLSVVLASMIRPESSMKFTVSAGEIGEWQNEIAGNT